MLIEQRWRAVGARVIGPAAGVGLAVAVVGAFGVLEQRLSDALPIPSGPAIATPGPAPVVAPAEVAPDAIAEQATAAPLDGSAQGAGVAASVAQPGDASPVLPPSTDAAADGEVVPPDHQIATATLWSGLAEPKLNGLPGGSGSIAPPDIIEARTVGELRRLFERADFRLAEVRDAGAPVPRLYVTGLPADLPQVRETDQRKRDFLRTVLPLVLLANEELRNRRGRLQDLLARIDAGDKVTLYDEAWLIALADLYGASPDDPEQLLRRVDSIPVSLALAQAIVESGWGTSRFAREGNALFGQRIWTDGSFAMVPEEAKQVRVRAFLDLMESVRSYMHNLNSHPAYARFREKRAGQRDRGLAPDGYDLAVTLTQYAEAENYPEKLRGLIRSNRLHDLEGARLESNFFARRRAVSTLVSADDG